MTVVKSTTSIAVLADDKRMITSRAEDLKHWKKKPPTTVSTQGSEEAWYLQRQRLFRH